MTKDDPPKRVMRFYGNTDYALQSIGFREINFVHRDKLNDPFDPHFSFATDFGENYETLIDFVSRHHAKDLQDFMGRFPQEEWTKFIGKIETYFNSLRDNTFLFSTSAIREGSHPKDNLYLWGHYANGHRGVAIEFDTGLLTKAVLEKITKLTGEDPNIDEVWSEVNYTDELSRITAKSIFQFVISDSQTPDTVAWDRTELANIIKLMVRSKSMEWKKEDEWRLMWLND